MFASLIGLDGLQLWLSIQLTTDLTQLWSGGSMFHPVSHIYAKTPFLWWNSWKQLYESSMRCCFCSTVSKRSAAFKHSFLIDKCSWKIFNTLPSTPLLITQLWFKVSQNEFGKFFCVFPDNCRIRVTWMFSIICVCTTAFKVSVLHLNRCFRRNRVRKIIIKPLHCLKRIFSHQKAMLYKHKKLRFFHCFENLQL